MHQPDFLLYLVCGTSIELEYALATLHTIDVVLGTMQYFNGT